MEGLIKVFHLLEVIYAKTVACEVQKYATNAVVGAKYTSKTA
jgi:hypothetical protein